MATISSGQITIIDLYDAPSINAWISAETTTAQTYNNTTSTYTPNYASTPQKLTLNLTKAGDNKTLIGANVRDVVWKKIIGGKTTEIVSTKSSDVEYMSGTANSVLTTKTNIPTTHNAIIWSVEGTWVDPNTKLPVAFHATIDLKLIQLAKASVVASLSAPNGDFFRNNTPSSLRVTCDVYKDGSISTGSRKYKWFIADTSVISQQDSDGGVGWKKVTATSGEAGVVANTTFDGATTSQGVLTVYPDAVVNAQTFMVVVTDNAGGTSGTKVKQFITLKDMDDPIMTVVESSGGNILKNGAGSTVLTARIYRNGIEIDESGKDFTYKWTKWENNQMSKNFGGEGVSTKLGKTLSIGSSDVNATSTFKVEVVEK